MTAIPCRPGDEPSSLHSQHSQSLAAQSCTDSDSDYETETSRNDSINCVVMDNISCGSTVTDVNNVGPTTFVTGPEAWPGHLQFKVNMYCI